LIHMQSRFISYKKNYVWALLILMSCQFQPLSRQHSGAASAAEPLVEMVNPDKLSSERPLRYKPVGSDIVIVNGNKRFNRALYGNHTAFRVEAGDLPEFLMYMPGKGGNLKLGLATDETDKWLIDAAQIKAIYRPGAMRYEIRDPLLGEDGQLNVQIWAMAEAEGMLISIESTPGTRPFELVWAYGGASGHRPARDGDIGADPEEGFYLHPEHCADNSFIVQINSFLLDYKIKDKKSQIQGIIPPAASLIIADARQQGSPKTLLQSRQAALPLVAGSVAVNDNEPVYFAFKNSESRGANSYKALSAAVEEAEKKRKQKAGQVRLNTPDPYLNTLGGVLSIAGDAIWDSTNYVHGAIAWRMPLNGWRGAYVADALGWHGRARHHFRAYSSVQLLEPASGPVVPDEDKNLARQKEEIGISLFTNGYISRNPKSKLQAHHYDMNMVFIDQLIRHLRWTGDTNYIREAWPILERHLAWEKRNFDVDDNGLYDAYCSFWASDAVQYSGGEVTHSSAYHYYANKSAAKLASLIGKDPLPYLQEAAKIKKAIAAELWLPEKGCYAEFKDLLGLRGRHTAPALWTIYHALDSEVADPFQAYQALRYVDTQIPHIPIRCSDLPQEHLETLTTTNWMPYTWSVNNVALAEVAHTALAYWQAGRSEEANRLMRSVLIESMYMGSSPGNLQQLSYYDHYRGELYRDFADGIGISARAIVEGMFGIVPDLQEEELLIRPGLPAQWEHASFETPDIRYTFRCEGNQETYSILPRFGKPLRLKFIANAQRVRLASVKVNGEELAWKVDPEAVGQPRILISAPLAEHYEVVIRWEGEKPEKASYPVVGVRGTELRADFGKAMITAIKDPQQIIRTSEKRGVNILDVELDGEEGHHTFFVQNQQGEMSWWQPVNIELREPFKLLPVKNSHGRESRVLLQNNTTKSLDQELSLVVGNFSQVLRLQAAPYGNSAEIAVDPAALISGTNRLRLMAGKEQIATGDFIDWHLSAGSMVDHCRMVDLDAYFNDNVTQIFENEYLSPRPASPTVQLPKHGIGNWCYPLVSPEIDDSGLRAKVDEAGVFRLPNGLPFRTTGPGAGNNIIFTSQWDNYPAEVSVPLEGQAVHAYLLMAGSTNPMQSRFDNGVVQVNYTDGTSERLILRNPETWWPIEQDYYINEYSFFIDRPKPIRVHLKSGEVPEQFTYGSINGFAYDSYVPGGAATVLDLPLNPKKELKSLTLSSLANDVVIGLMAVTLISE
jgi:hypothetical protein